MAAPFGPVAHTVARGQLDENTFFLTGLMEKRQRPTLPFPVSMEVLARSRTLQHLLHALSLPRRQQRRNDRAARLQACGNFPARESWPRSAGPLFPCDDPRLRRHAPDYSAQLPGRPLGSRHISGRCRSARVPTRLRFLRGFRFGTSRTSQSREEISRLLCSALVVARDRGLRPTARPQPGNTGNGPSDVGSPDPWDDPARHSGSQWRDCDAAGREIGRGVGAQTPREHTPPS